MCLYISYICVLACWNGVIIEKLQVCAALSFLAIISSMLQFTLDLCGTSNRGLFFVWSNSIGNIISGKKKDVFPFSYYLSFLFLLVKFFQ